jgi:hypothetical protein
VNNGPHSLNYFTHEVDGQLHGGWYRKSGDFIEVLAKGTSRVKPLYGSSPEIEARSVLEEIIKAKAAIGSGRKHK